MRHQLDEERAKFRKNEEARLRKEVEEETSIKLKDKQNETEELRVEKRKLHFRHSRLRRIDKSSLVARESSTFVSSL